MWKPSTDPNFPWTGILFGAPILGVWYWCTDQFIVQRVLSARDQTEARRGTIFAGFLKLLPLFLFVVPGLVAYALAQRGRLALESPDQALPALVGTLLPAGLRGIVVAGLLAALMSSLSSVFNSCSTLITWDVYKKLHPAATERRLVWVGRVSTAVLVALGLLWIPLMQLISGQLYQYLQSVQAYISPPIAAVFLIGILWRRVNARGAMAALLTGFVLGVVRLVAELNRESLGGWLRAYADINFLHFAVLLFVICTAVLVVASLTAPAPSDEKVAGLTFATAPPAEAGTAARARGRDALLSLLLILCVGALWWYFS
jgi:SSS family solute:Na+ symporter